MIFTERTIKVSNGEASIDSPIILYRGDREIEILFKIIDSKYKFSAEKGNYIKYVDASFGQLAIDCPNGSDVFTKVTPCIDGAVTFTITGEMIDELTEVGYYSFHIRLFNSDQTSRITIPAIMNGIEIKEPLVIEGDVGPYVDVSDKLESTESEFTSGWWYQNKANNLEAEQMYLYVTVLEGNDIDTSNWVDHGEMSNSAWVNDNKLTTHKMLSTNRDIYVLYSEFTPNNDRLSTTICIRANGKTLENPVTIKSYLYSITNSEPLDESAITTIGEIFASGKTLTDTNLNPNPNESDTPTFEQWNNKKILMIGDSITASGRIHPHIARSLRADVSTHAKGGIGIAQGVDGDKGYSGEFDNETDANGNLSPLSVNHVYDKDIIIVLIGYNNRYNQLGVQTDIYPENNTIWGLFNHVINRIYELLAESENLKCRLMIAIPHAIGKYPYVNATAYEKPTEESPTFVEICDCIRTVAETYSIPICDLMHSSGINKFTWNVFGASNSPINEQYTKYELDENGDKVNDKPLRYVKGNSYYQNRDGKIVYEVYEGSAPFPYNNDQCHCSELGYSRISECIIGALIHAFGNNIG